MSDRAGIAKDYKKDFYLDEGLLRKFMMSSANSQDSCQKRPK
jgi:hypothetical protein